MSEIFRRPPFLFYGQNIQNYFASKLANLVEKFFLIDLMSRQFLSINIISDFSTKNLMGWILSDFGWTIFWYNS
jgi:hypothetical protein